MFCRNFDFFFRGGGGSHLYFLHTNTPPAPFHTHTLLSFFFFFSFFFLFYHIMCKKWLLFIFFFSFMPCQIVSVLVPPTVCQSICLSFCNLVPPPPSNSLSSHLFSTPYVSVCVGVSVYVSLCLFFTL